MSHTDALIAELKVEGAATRRMLERIPTDKNDWKPHEKSTKMGNLAVHVAELPSWVEMIVNADELDLATMNYKPVIPTSTEQLLGQLDTAMNKAVAALEHATDEQMGKVWTLRKGSHVIAALPKAAMIRSMVFSHHYHHRGQLSVYLRLLDIPVPGMYGPSSDDMAAMAAQAQAAQAN